MSAAEVDAVVTRLKGTPSAPLNAYDAQPESPAYPYVIVYADAGLGFSDREDDSLNARTVSFQTVTVGQSAGQCRAALDRAVGSLEGWTPTVSGRSCSRMVHEGSQPVRKDDEFPDRVLFIGTDQWSFVSEPA